MFCLKYTLININLLSVYKTSSFWNGCGNNERRWFMITPYNIEPTGAVLCVSLPLSKGSESYIT